MIKNGFIRAMDKKLTEFSLSEHQCKGHHQR